MTPTKIYTRTGDEGETYCAALRRRVPKDHPLIEFVGTLDEAISSIGLAASLCSENEKIIKILKYFQRLLFNIGFHLSGSRKLSGDEVNQLELIIDEYMNNIELKGFILPGGSPCSSAIHYARSVTRRAERRLVAALKEEESIDKTRVKNVLKILNRLSDALFAIALRVQFEEGTLEYL